MLFYTHPCPIQDELLKKYDNYVFSKYKICTNIQHFMQMIANAKLCYFNMYLLFTRTV